MNFGLTNEQSMLVDTARSLFERECPPSLVRGVAVDPSDAHALFERHLRSWVELGVGDAVDLTLFLIEAGAVVAPGPFLATAALFAPLLAASGHDMATAAATGEITGTVAIAGPEGVWRPSADRSRTQVIDLDLVDQVAVVVLDGVQPAIAVVPATSVVSRRIDTMDLARGVFDVEVPGDSELRPIEPATLDRVLGRWAVAFAAEMIGVSRWLQETSVAYAGERIQFGKPIGAFQGLQFRMVDAALRHERATAAVSYAAMCLDADDPDWRRAVHVAKAEAGIAARGWARDGLQVHGGVGYTWEHGLHLRLRRAYGNDALCGTTSWHHDRLAELIFDS